MRARLTGTTADMAGQASRYFVCQPGTSSPCSLTLLVASLQSQNRRPYGGGSLAHNSTRHLLRTRRRQRSCHNGCGTRRTYAATTNSKNIPSVVTVPVDEARFHSNTDNDNDNDSDCDDDYSTKILHQLSKEQKTLQQTELANIIRPYHKTQTPVVVRGAVKQTPATRLWSSWEYWQKLVSEQHQQQDDNDNHDHDHDPLVAVELGGSYGCSETSERAEIPFSAYLQFLALFDERHGSIGSVPGRGTDIDGSASSSSAAVIPSEELVYMAQNDLLPALYPDVMIPSFCCREDGDDDESDNDNGTATSNKIGLGRLYSVMMWLGPRGCVSPLHFDPLDNCFMQHKGRKRVLLFAPTTSSSSLKPWHYAGHEGQQSNTSSINPEVLDCWTATTKASSIGNDTAASNNTMVEEHLQKYPLFFQEAPERLECVLEPGDLLYIPAKWWHHVRSIDASASVNVWWR